MDRWGDVADGVAQDLMQEQIDELDQSEETVEEHRVIGWEKTNLLSKIEFKWKKEDELVLARIRAASDTITKNHFITIFKALDAVYGNIRVPKVNQNGMTVFDENGRIVWERNPDGSYKEDWSLLDGFDIEAAIFELQKAKTELAVQNNSLFQEAVFAKYIYRDEYQDSYRSLLDGTQGDRNSFAHKATRESRYFAFYKFCLWNSSDILLKEINNLQRIMERIREWRIRSYRSEESLKFQ